MSAIDEMTGSIRAAEVRRCRDVSKGYTSFRENDILFAKITPCMQNGKAAIARKLIGGFGFGSTEFHVLRPGPEVLPEWIFAFVRQPSFRAAAGATFTGTAGQQRVPTNFVSRSLIPIPPIPQQERIVAILDAAEALRSLREQADRRTADLIPALFHQMFGGSATTKKWPKCRVDQAGEVQLGRQRAPKFQSGKWTCPYLRVANVFEDRIDINDLLSMDFDNRDFETYLLKGGDILLNEGQSTELVGRPAMWRNEKEGCCFQNTLIRFRGFPDKVVPEFALSVLLRYYRSGEFSKISSKTSNVAHLGAGRFSGMPFPLPPISLQRAFAARVAGIRAMEPNQVSSRRRLDDLFQSLLHRAFSGKL